MKKLLITLISLSAFQAHTGDHDTPTRKSPRFKSDKSEMFRLRAITGLKGKKKGKLSPIKNAPLARLEKLPSSVKLPTEKSAIPSILKKLSPTKSSPKRRSTIAAGASSATHTSSSAASENTSAPFDMMRLRERKSSTALPTGDSNESGRKVSFLDSKSSARASFSPYNQAGKSARKSSVFKPAGSSASASASENI